MHHDGQSSNWTHSRCSAGEASLTHHSFSRPNGQLAEGVRVMETGPGSPTFSPRSQAVSGWALTPKQQMVMKLWPIINHPTYLLLKKACWDSAICCFSMNVLYCQILFRVALVFSISLHDYIFSYSILMISEKTWRHIRKLVHQRFLKPDVMSLYVMLL